MKRISDECRKLGFHRWTHLDIHGLSAALSAKIRGWLYYYGRFHKTAMQRLFEIMLCWSLRHIEKLLAIDWKIQYSNIDILLIWGRIGKNRYLVLFCKWLFVCLKYRVFPLSQV